MNQERRIGAYTLIELVIVIAIVAISSIVTGVFMRGAVRKAMYKEGEALVKAIANNEKRYFSDHSVYRVVASTECDTSLNIDARSNRYFKRFSVATVGSGRMDSSFTAYATGSGDASGISVTFSQPSLTQINSGTTAPSLSSSGF